MPSDKLEKKTRSQRTEVEEETKSKSKSRSKESENYEGNSREKSEKRTSKEEDKDKERRREERERRKEDEDRERRKGEREKRKEDDDKDRRRDEDKEKRRGDDKERRRDDDKERRKDEDRDKSKNSRKPKIEENDEGESRRSKHDKKRDDEGGEKHRSSRSRKEEENERDERRHKESRDGSEEKSKKHHKSKSKDEDSGEKESKSREGEKKTKKVEIVERIEEEPVYEDDFDNDFEEIESDEAEVKPKKVFFEKHDEEKGSSKKVESGSSKKAYDYDDYEEEVRYNSTKLKDKVIKANAHILIPTDLVEVHSSKIYFNHDSIDRQQRRAKDLIKTRTIELDRKNFNLLEINPIEMRTVYSSHLKHEKVQTNDDVTEIETQTDEIDYVNRWVQHPPEDSKGFGTDETNQNDQDSFGILENLKADINFTDLQRFLNNSSKVIEKLFSENSSATSSFNITTKTDLEFSLGFTKFALPKNLTKFYKNYNLTMESFRFSSESSDLLVATYNLNNSKSNETDIMPNGSLLLVWNLNDPVNPYRVLICETKSTCACYTDFLVFSGTEDGSVVLWDLRESSSLHSLKFKEANGVNVLRSPTYTTAGVLFNENHFSEVKSILPLQSLTKSNNGKGVFMQLATLELECKLIIWTVVELSNVDLAGFETDLGLLPGGKIKLIKSSQIELNNLIRQPTSLGDRIQFQTICMACPMNTTNYFYICTNSGRIIQIVRENDSLSSKSLKSEFSEGNLQVCYASFHQEVPEVLLAGYGNGELRLYHTNYVLPIKTWNLACQGNKINEIHWIPTKSSSFIVTDERGTIYFWNLLADDTQPIYSMPINGFGGISLPFTKQTTNTDDKNIPFSLFNLNSKEFEVHLLKPDYPSKSEKEGKKFPKLIKNYLLTF